MFYIELRQKTKVGETAMNKNTKQIMFFKEIFHKKVAADFD